MPFKYRGGILVKVRIATVEDVQVLHQLHFDLNCHRHTLQPTNFQGRSVDEEWICQNIMSSDKDYLVLEVEDEVVGMALIEKKEGHTVNGSVRYRYLYLRDFMIDASLCLQTYGHEFFKEIRRYGKKNFLSYIQLNELINDKERLKFFEKEQLLVTQQTLKSAI